MDSRTTKNRGPRRALITMTMAGFVAFQAVAADPLSEPEREIRAALKARSTQQLSLLEELVAQNSGSANLPGLRIVADRLRAELDALGFETEVVAAQPVERPGESGQVAGPIVIGRRVGASEGPRFLLVGHYDTVFEPEHPFQGLEIADDTLHGPGVADMKGGLVVMLEALRALRDADVLQRASWVVLLNGDEETGSLASRAQIEEEARKADVGFVFESSRGVGGMVRSRRGLGQFYLEVEGVAAHAGSAHERGRSAVLELAKKIQLIEALTDYPRGVTLNVGVIGGGTKRNVVPREAWAWIDLRYDRPEDGERVRAEIERIAASQLGPDTKSRLWGRLHRPPKLETAAVSELLRRHREVAAALGSELPPGHHAGGGTDGSLMGAVGLPTLDSMGVIGANAHTDRETASLASLTGRAALAAILLRRLVVSPALPAPPGGVD